MAAKKTNKSAGGIGPSRTFAAPAGTFAQQPEFTIEGVPVSNSPHAHAIPSHYSDEAIAERAARPHAVTSVTRDAFDKKILERADFRTHEAEPWLAPDPMKELIAEHCPSGHVPRFLSEKKVAQDGFRGWQPVISDTGDPIRLGNMALASMPKDMAERRNKYYRKLDADKISDIHEQTREQGGRLAHANGMRVAAGSTGFQRQMGGDAAALGDD